MKTPEDMTRTILSSINVRSQFMWAKNTVRLIDSISEEGVAAIATLLTAWRDECVEEVRRQGYIDGLDYIDATSMTELDKLRKELRDALQDAAGYKSWAEHAEEALEGAMDQWKIVESERYRLKCTLELGSADNDRLRREIGEAHESCRMMQERLQRLIEARSKEPDPMILEDNLMAIQG
jgi:hypothetical protein